MSELKKNSGSLLLLGVNHTTAPLDVRERLAIPVSRLADATRTLAHQPGVREALILSTCNRVELLTVQDDVVAAAVPPMGMLRFLHDYLNLPANEIEPHVYEFREREAIRHLFRVASSLDSMVVGEPQILGQVKESWTVAREVGAVKSTLDPLLQRAFSVAKKVRTETQIGSSTVSIASVAAELARKIFGSLSGKTVLIVGAGKMSDLAARHLIQQGATTLLVSNRTEARAEKIADSLRTPAITTGVIPFDQLHEQSHRADIVITSTGAGHVFTPAHARALLHRRRNRPIFFIDIAVPRDVAPEINNLEGCFVYDMDDLQQVAAQNQAVRSREAEAAESIVSREVERYGERLAQAPATEAIKQLLLDAETLRQQELARTAQRLSPQPLTPEQLAAIDALTKSLTAKLLHPQIAALREAANTPDPDE
ncbi:glutamyl-tRNA reductase [Granulicella sp. S156]|jgi:glutamyl-tRNA reductase|uniref:glutamyl-tRNA reductase n=1 Tax=Granulicella sp. S156 TaxID=1747224 RepID=UPI00131B3513|nr:glutamyl-tRNA reductase [Granulicella sp. S156]